MSQVNCTGFYGSGVGIKRISETEKIEKIVYSLWTAPSGGDILNNAINWTTPRAQLLCLTLSVNIAKKHFKKIELVTDSAGWKIIKQLKLPFTSVKTILDDIPKEKHSFWALGKIYAYQCQDEPFIHLDNDAILWNGLPEWALIAPVLVQNIEDGDWYNQVYAHKVKHLGRELTYFPPMWGEVREAYCTGIFGGTDIQFIKHYCNEVLKFINNDNNKKGWNKEINKGGYCIIFEQYILAILSNAYNKKIVFLDKHLNIKNLEKLGYTHIWGAKKDSKIEGMLEKAMKKHFPKSLTYVNGLFNKKKSNDTRRII